MKLLNFFKKRRFETLSLILLGVLAFFMADRNYYIGGDVMYPLHPLNNLYKSFMWYSGAESQHSLHFIWYMYYFALDFIGIPSFIAHKILILALLFAGFKFTQLLFKDIFSDIVGVERASIVAGFLFILSPAYYLVVDAYLPLYGYPICFYFLIRYLKTNKLRYSIFFAVCMNTFFFVDLPQVKQLIIFSLSGVFLMALYIHLYSVRPAEIVRKLFAAFWITIGLNLWVALPFVFSVLGGAVGGFSTNLAAYEGVADLGTATIFYMVRLFNKAVIHIYPGISDYLVSWYFVGWTFLLLVVLLAGAFVFSRKDKHRKSYLILLVAIFTLVFIAKGANPPFGEIYRFIVVNIPVARIFRTTAYVVIAAALFYALSLGLLSAKLTQHRNGNYILNVLILIHIMVFYPVFLGHKFYSFSDTELEYRGYKISQEYWDMGKKLDSIESDSKVLLLPHPGGYVSKKWGYSGADLLTWITRKELVLRQDEYGLSLESKTGIQSGGDFYNSFVFNNASHVLLQKDGIGVPMLDASDTLTEIEDDSYFTLYEVNPKMYLPKIYSPTKTVYVQSKLADINNVLDFENYDMRSQVYFNDPSSRVNNEMPKNIKVTARDFFVVPERQKNQLLSDPTWDEGWALPEANTSPSSLSYALVKLNELKEIYQARNVTDRADVYVWLSSKRVAELLKFDLSERQTDMVIGDYVGMLGHIKTLLSSFSEQDRDETFWGIVRKALVYTSTSYADLHSIDLTDDQRQRIQDAFTDLEVWINKVGNPDCEGFCYKFQAPISGNFTVYMDTSEAFHSLPSNSLDIFLATNIGVLSRTVTGGVDAGTWTELGAANLEEAQNYKYDSQLPEFRNLIVPGEWRTFDSEYENGLDLKAQSIFSSTYLTKKGGDEYKRTVVSTPLVEWEPDKEYKIKFDYLVSDGFLGISVVEEVPTYAKISEAKKFDSSSYPLNYKPNFTKELDEKSDEQKECTYYEGNNCYKTYERLFKSSKEASNALIIAYMQAGKDSISAASLRNLSVTRYIVPKIVLRSTQPQADSHQTVPDITYVRINPTRYLVKVSNVSGPYTLVFGENFNSSWKVYSSGGSDHNTLEKIEKTYFGGAVNEGLHSDRFVYNGMFDTWFSNSISDDKHYVVNGYANAWDLDSNAQYLIIEFTPQRIQYIGIALTALFISWLVVFNVVTYFRKRVTK